MANRGLSMRKVREVLRLHYVAGLSGRAIARSLKLSPVTVKRYIRRAEEAGLGWPLPEWSKVHRELRRKGVTLALLWQEYKEADPLGMQYSWFCKLYRAWTAKLDVVMRFEHRAGEKMFVDYAGQTVAVVERDTGELREAQIFVAQVTGLEPGEFVLTLGCRHTDRDPATTAYIARLRLAISTREKQVFNVYRDGGESGRPNSGRGRRNCARPRARKAAERLFDGRAARPGRR